MLQVAMKKLALRRVKARQDLSQASWLKLLKERRRDVFSDAGLPEARKWKVVSPQSSRAAILAGACGHAVKPDRRASNTPADVRAARKLTASPVLQPAPPIVVLEPTLRPYTHAVPSDAPDLLLQHCHVRLKLRKGCGWVWGTVTGPISGKKKTGTGKISSVIFRASTATKPLLFLPVRRPIPSHQLLGVKKNHPTCSMQSNAFMAQAVRSKTTTDGLRKQESHQASLESPRETALKRRKLKGWLEEETPKAFSRHDHLLLLNLLHPINLHFCLYISESDCNIRLWRKKWLNLNSPDLGWSAKPSASPALDFSRLLTDLQWISSGWT
ncbi:hypothetical protein FIBSPDRAFT_890388 [Athelia psychrophila]|uniref:Uncharacterized protein n=1 Tax=Athelia psychrophila TaxID=1759441 RepID=A0A166L2P3_9AGAM|nr:hypothetical protein FIBSPDRAFT_890388 [Fibularhizoctonia sp. CBS 109695]